MRKNPSRDVVTPSPQSLAHSPIDWWRDAVIYQIYPRSFADSNGDGVGDLPGIISRLPEIAELGIDAIGLSPFYTSPQKDGGYDMSNYCDVDPISGSLHDAKKLMTANDSRGLRISIDLVPHQSSDQLPWFQAALAAPPQSSKHERYIFRYVLGEEGEPPPNNWESVFGGFPGQ